MRYPAVGSPGGLTTENATPLRSRGPYPLVMFSQGFDISPEAYFSLLNAWAAAGYVVADPAYPFTSPGALGGVVRTDIVHHPRDMSFVISSLLAANSTTGQLLSSLINGREIAAIGQSDGGDVTLAATNNSCCRDRRIKAAVILSGAELSWFPGTYFSGPGVPLLVVQGTRDFVMNPIECSIQLYDGAPAPKYYLAMIGQTHLSAYIPPGPDQRLVTHVTIDFLNGYLRHSAQSLVAMTTLVRSSRLATITSQPTLSSVSGGCLGAP